MRCNFRFKFNRSIDAIIKSSGINIATLQYTMSAARELMESFVPKESGRLIDSATVNVNGDKRGTITYDGPYARRHYYNPWHNFNGAPRRGSFWDVAMLNEYEGELYARVDRFIRGK